MHRFLENMRANKNWTKEEEEYLIEKWGTLSLKTIAQNLGRSENAILVRKNRLELGGFLDNGEYITFNQLLIAIGVDNGGYKKISWIKNRNFPIRRKRVNNCSFRVVYIEDFWKWAEKNRDVLDFSKFETNILGKEPAWAREKRRHDIEKARKYIATPWTKAEDEKLKYLVERKKYTYDDLSKMLRRTNGAIQRRLMDLNIKERPVKADNHTNWTEDDHKKLGELIKKGYGYDLLAEEIGKSSKACRGHVYQMYLTEKLDKVRKIIGDGNFGDNRPERKIKQWNVMDAQERNKTKEDLTRLISVLQYVGNHQQQTKNMQK